VTIGGGTGSFPILRALKNQPVNLTAIVSMADDGGMAGVLRDEYGVLPPSDVRKTLVALAEPGSILRELFNYRFSEGSFKGCAFGNFFLAALEKITGSFAEAVKEASKVLKVKGSVIPVTLSDARLCAKLADGAVIKGETNIDIPTKDFRPAIKKVWLEPKAEINPQAETAIKTADLIVICPGDLYTSIIPNFLVKGMKEAVKKSKAKKVCFVNLMTKFGETHGFKAEDFIKTIEKYLGRDALDFVVFNSKKPRAEILKRYKKEKAEFVEPPGKSKKTKPVYIRADLLASGGFIRHDPGEKTSKILLAILNELDNPNKNQKASF